MTQALEQRFAELETRTEERHTENLAATGQLADEVHLLRGSLEAHVRADDRAMNELSRSLNENTTVTKDVHTIVSAVRGMMTVGGWLKTGLHWAATILLSAAIIFAVILWAMGKGPFPPIHP